MPAARQAPRCRRRGLCRVHLRGPGRPCCVSVRGMATPSAVPGGHAGVLREISRDLFPRPRPSPALSPGTLPPAWPGREPAQILARPGTGSPDPLGAPRVAGAGCQSVARRDLGGMTIPATTLPRRGHRDAGSTTESRREHVAGAPSPPSDTTTDHRRPSTEARRPLFWALRVVPMWHEW
jgi:hypothetical protein